VAFIVLNCLSCDRSGLHKTSELNSILPIGDKHLDVRVGQGSPNLTRTPSLYLPPSLHDWREPCPWEFLTSIIVRYPKSQNSPPRPLLAWSNTTIWNARRRLAVGRPSPSSLCLACPGSTSPLVKVIHNRRKTIRSGTLLCSNWNMTLFISASVKGCIKFSFSSFVTCRISSS
jgi:hypothetical protein